jgi:hypothetical protein
MTGWPPALDEVHNLASTHGLVASYHPHLSTIVESPEELEQLLPRTQIAFCPTPLIWQQAAGIRRL